MKEIGYLLLGAIVGAVAALMFAPKSGTELRGEIQQRANVDLQRLQQSYEQNIAEMNKKLEQIQTQLKKNQQMGEELVETANEAASAEVAA